MSLADTGRDRLRGTARIFDATGSRWPVHGAGSKELYRAASRVANKESVQPNMGRVQQNTRQIYVQVLRQPFVERVVARATTPAPKPRVLERFEGFVEKVEGGAAYVTLQSEGGDRLCGVYPVAELAERDVHEQDRFVLTTIEQGDAVRFEVRLVPRRKVSPERQKLIDQEIDRELRGYTTDDDY